MEVPQPTGRNTHGKTLGRYLKLSKRLKTFAQENRQKERVAFLTARMTHKATRAKKQMEQCQADARVFWLIGDDAVVIIALVHLDDIAVAGVSS